MKFFSPIILFGFLPLLSTATSLPVDSDTEDHDVSGAVKPSQGVQINIALEHDKTKKSEKPEPSMVDALPHGKT